MVILAEAASACHHRQHRLDGIQYKRPSSLTGGSTD
jgi:hypothetical protein